MKTYCRSCGCHFPEDFEETMKPECAYWPSKGLPQHAVQRNREILQKYWDYIFAFDYDKAADETGLIFIPGSFTISPKMYVENEFERDVPGYKDWDDLKRRKFQKEWFKSTYDGSAIKTSFSIFIDQFIDRNKE